MSLAIIGVAGTVIGAGASIYGQYQQGQNQKKAASAAAGLNVGTKPVAAEYKPVDFGAEQLQTIADNYKASGHPITDLATQTDNILTGTALARARQMIPSYNDSIRTEANATNSLLKGQLPYDDVLGIVAGQTGASNMVGTPGGSAPATMRDLGLSRLDAIKTGTGLMGGMVDMAEKLNPVGRQFLPQSMYVNPMDRIQTAMQQNQLIQQSDQNRNNIEAAPTPSQALQAQVALGNLSAGGGGGSNIGGYASALQGLLGGIGKFASSSSTPSGTYEGSFATNPSPMVRNQIYRPTTSIAV